MINITKPGSIVMARCDYDAKTKTTSLRLHLRVDGHIIEDEIYVQFPSHLCDDETSAALREFADAVSKRNVSIDQSSEIRFASNDRDERYQAERLSALQAISNGFRRLEDLFEKARVRRALSPRQKSSIDPFGGNLDS